MTKFCGKKYSHHKIPCGILLSHGREIYLKSHIKILPRTRYFPTWELFSSLSTSRPPVKYLPKRHCRYMTVTGTDMILGWCSMKQGSWSFSELSLNQSQLFAHGNWRKLPKSEQTSWNNIIAFQEEKNHVFYLGQVRIFIDLKSHNKEMSQTRSEGTPAHLGRQRKAG